MAEDAITYRQGGTTVRVEGLNRVLRKLNQAGTDAQNMRDLMHSLGGIIINRARVPIRTGRLAESLRAGRGKTKAVVRAGRASVPYAGVIHYGGYNNITPNPYLVGAVQESRGQVFAALEAGIDDLLKKNNLK